MNDKGNDDDLFKGSVADEDFNLEEEQYDSGLSREDANKDYGNNFSNDDDECKESLFMLSVNKDTNSRIEGDSKQESRLSINRNLGDQLEQRKSRLSEQMTQVQRQLSKAKINVSDAQISRKDIAPIIKPTDKVDEFNDSLLDDNMDNDTAECKQYYAQHLNHVQINDIKSSIIQLYSKKESPKNPKLTLEDFKEEHELYIRSKTPKRLDDVLLDMFKDESAAGDSSGSSDNFSKQSKHGQNPNQSSSLNYFLESQKNKPKSYQFSDLFYQPTHIMVKSPSKSKKLEAQNQFLERMQKDFDNRTQKVKQDMEKKSISSVAISPQRQKVLCIRLFKEASIKRVERDRLIQKSLERSKAEMLMQQVHVRKPSQSIMHHHASQAPYDKSKVDAKRLKNLFQMDYNSLVQEVSQQIKSAKQPKVINKDIIDPQKDKTHSQKKFQPSQIKQQKQSTTMVAASTQADKNQMPSKTAIIPKYPKNFKIPN